MLIVLITFVYYPYSCQLLMLLLMPLRLLTIPTGFVVTAAKFFVSTSVLRNNITDTY